MKAILVVGPSGAGKDTLLCAAREYFQAEKNIGFAKRYITRPPDTNEDNYYVDESGFTMLEKSSYFISTWRAHGNCYGIPRNQFSMASGQESKIVSISRSAIQDFEDSCNNAVTLVVTASREMLEQRLLIRGRESTEKVKKRLQHAAKPVVAQNSIVFDNSGDLLQSIDDFVSLLHYLHRG